MPQPPPATTQINAVIHALADCYRHPQNTRLLRQLQQATLQAHQTQQLTQEAKVHIRQEARKLASTPQETPTQPATEILERVLKGLRNLP